MAFIWRYFLLFLDFYLKIAMIKNLIENLACDLALGFFLVLLGLGGFGIFSQSG